MFYVVILDAAQRRSGIHFEFASLMRESAWIPGSGANCVRASPGMTTWD